MALDSYTIGRGSTKNVFFFVLVRGNRWHCTYMNLRLANICTVLIPIPQACHFLLGVIRLSDVPSGIYIDTHDFVLIECIVKRCWYVKISIFDMLKYDACQNIDFWHASRFLYMLRYWKRHISVQLMEQTKAKRVLLREFLPLGHLHMRWRWACRLVKATSRYSRHVMGHVLYTNA